MKKILAIALMVCMLLTFAIPLSVSAEDGETATITVSAVVDGETVSAEYDSWASAVDAANAYWVLGENGAASSVTATNIVITFNGNIKSGADKEIHVPCKIVGNDHTITFNFNGDNYIFRAKNVIDVEGLNIVSNKNGIAFYGVETVDGTVTGAVKYAAADVTLKNVNFTVESGKMFFGVDRQIPAKKVTVIGGTYNCNSGNMVAESGTNNDFTIDGAVFNFNQNSAGTAVFVTEGSTFTIKGNATLDASKTGGIAIKYGSLSTINIESGEIKANGHAIMQLKDGENAASRGNVINISGGSVSTNGSNKDAIQIYDKKDSTNDPAEGDETVINISGGVLRATRYVINNYTNTARAEDDYKRYSVINVTGGILESTGADVFFYNQNGASHHVDADINIYGGYFHSKDRMFDAANQDSTNVTGNIYIYGGTFVSDARTFARAGVTKVYVYGGEFFVDGTHDDKKTFFLSGTMNVEALQGCRIWIPVSHDVTSTNDNGDTIVYEGITGVGISLLVALGNWVTPVGSAMKYLGSNDFALKDGAAVRLVDDGQGHGIRFTSIFKNDAIDKVTALKDENTDLTYGTILVPTAKLANVRSYTIAALEKEGLKAKSETLTSGYDFAVIDAVDGYEVDESTGDVTVRLSLTNLKNVDTKFSAIPYIKYVKNGATVYVYGEYYSEKTDSRSMAEIAFAALTDAKDGKDAALGYRVQVETAYTVTLGSETVTVDAGKWVPYSEAQRETLKSYLAN